MAAVTYHVVIPFLLSEDGELFPGEPQEAPNGAAAIARARRIVETSGGGAIAFSRSGDPSLGEFDEARCWRPSGRCPPTPSAPNQVDGCRSAFPADRRGVELLSGTAERPGSDMTLPERGREGTWGPLDHLVEIQ